MARLRMRLVLMALVVIVPAIGMVVYDQSVARAHAREQAIEDMVRLARVAAERQSEVFTEVVQLLRTLTRLPADAHRGSHGVPRTASRRAA